MATPSTDLFAGIDIGTGGVRVVILDEAGDLVAGHAEPVATVTGVGGRTVEQDASLWWTATVTGLQKSLVSCPRGELRALAISGTSGTIVPVDGAGEALRPAVLYRDARAAAAAERLNQAAAAWTQASGVRFQSSSGLAKVLWLVDTEPEVVSRTRVFAHAADIIVTRLTGEVGLTDWSHALKTGYDLVAGAWPSFLDAVGIPVAKLPRVLPPGAALGRVTAAAGATTSVPAGVPVIAGMTDGCMAQVAAGAVQPGDWNTSLGTTLVLKGVTRTRLVDPEGRVYSHRLPSGAWLPGAASNTGGACLDEFPRAGLPSLDARALAETPTGRVVYPLTLQGERFPFLAPQARGFGEVVADPVERRFAARLEGVAFVERLGYAVLEDLGASVGGVIGSTGGGSRSRAWLQVRADVLNRTLRRPVLEGAAAGAAMLAAAGVTGRDLADVARTMVRIDCVVEPRSGVRSAYDEAYARFVGDCRARGYLDSPARSR